MESTIAMDRPWIDHALAHDTLYARTKPIVEISTGAVVADESLARWRDPDLNPGVELTRDHLLFINVEASTLGVPVPEWAVPLLDRAADEPRIVSTPTTVSTPFALVADSPRLKVGRRDVLLGLSNHLESLGLGHDDLVLLGAFQSDDRFTPATRRRYEMLAERCALVGAFGVGMSDQPAAGIRGASLEEGESLVHEWVVAVVGSHCAGALIAKDLGDDGSADAPGGSSSS